MVERNPMRNPATRAKVSNTLKGRPVERTLEGAERIRAAARRRMLTDNPMNNPETAARVWDQLRTRRFGVAMSESEKLVQAIARRAGVAVEFTGARTLRVADPFPDFRITGTRALLEVTQDRGFGNVPRTVEGYALPRIAAYEAAGWRCLVIYLARRISSRTAEKVDGLAEAIRSFSTGGPSGVWRSGAFDPFLA